MVTPETREYRSFEIRQKEEKEADDSMILEGRAVVFNSPEVMFEFDGVEYFEQIDRHAFDEAEMDDVILNVNHEGQALARTRNNTLDLELSEDGLDITADMAKSRASRDAYEAVQNGLLDKMSFAFTVREDAYDEKTHTRTVLKIDRLYDVSLVNFPAYEATSVSARSYFEAKAEAEHRAAEAAEKAAEAAKEREEKRAALYEQLNELEAIDALSEHAAEIRTELSADDADLEKMAEKVADLEARKAEIRKAAEERAKEAEKIAKGDLGKTKETHKERKKMTLEEMRSSHEYAVAYANYIKTGKDSQCRALLEKVEKRDDDPETDPTLLTENVSGTIPVPTSVEGIVRTAWERDGIVRRIRKTYFKGNHKVFYEVSGTDAVEHTEGSGAVDAEELVLATVNMIPKMIKKWVPLSDEVLELTGEEFLMYIYDELAYRIVKKLGNLIIDDITALADGTAIGPAVATEEVEALGIDSIALALGNLSDDAENPVAIMNKKTWSALKAAAKAANFADDPFEGLDVVFRNTLADPSTASAGDPLIIVGDLEIGAQANFPNGDDIKYKIDDKTQMTSDIVNVLGKLFAAHAVVAPYAFAVVTLAE